MTTKFYIGARLWPGISKLVEECGEVIQIAGKLLGTGGEEQHFSGLNLRAALQEEIADVLAAIGYVIEHCNLDRAAIRERAMAKRKVFETWHREQIERDRTADPSLKPRTRIRRGREIAGLTIGQASRLLAFEAMAKLYRTSVAWLLGDEPKVPEHAHAMLRNADISAHDRDTLIETLGMWFTPEEGKGS
jgi:NTP pyrophosphatase (non-canonical NTP hydrolase)